MALVSRLTTSIVLTAIILVATLLPGFFTLKERFDYVIPVRAAPRPLERASVPTPSDSSNGVFLDTGDGPPPLGILEKEESWFATQNGLPLIFPAVRQAPKVLDEIRVNHPDCPYTCKDGWIQDGWCDSECNNEECGFDGGDCEGWCGGECRPEWPGDGQCDIECYKEACMWDGGDCQEWSESNLPSSTSVQQQKLWDYSKCKCEKGKLGNGVCNPECNTYECRFDGLDCFRMCDSECPNAWLGDGVCDRECDTVSCYEDKGDCRDCGAHGCRLWMIGNAICDPNCNVKECQYDGGDCDNITKVVLVNYNTSPNEYQFCSLDFIGDGHCDENCYNAESLWDGGDCSGTQFALKQAERKVGPEFPTPS